MNQRAVLLATIEAALEIQSRADPLSAPEVTKLGRQLGLSDERTCDLVRELSADGKVDLQWGGAVKSVQREPSASSIYLGAHATYVGPGAQIQNSAVGAGAHVQITAHSQQTPEEALTQIVAALTVPLDKLTVELTGTSLVQEQAYRQLVELTEALQQQLLGNEKPDKNALSKKLAEADAALGMLEKAGKLGTAAAPYLPHVWNMLHHAFQSLSGYLVNL